MEAVLWKLIEGGLLVLLVVYGIFVGQLLGELKEEESPVGEEEETVGEQ